MRLLITADPLGGVWRFAQELTKGLLDFGHAVALVSLGAELTRAQCAECDTLQQKWSGRFRFVAADLPLEWMQNNERCFEAGAAVIERVAREFGAQFLHVNQYCYGALQVPIPKLVTAHSDVLSWARSCRDQPLEESAWLSRYCALVQRGLDCADAVTAPTAWMLNALAEGFHLPQPAVVIPNGRSVGPQRVGPRALRAVTAGRLWDEGKDIALLGAVRSPMPLVVAGETECNGDRTNALSGVRLCGTLAEAQMLRLFQESAVYICTSRYEPFGLAPLEAALCGCAVLARDIESLREVWSDGALYFRDAEELSAILMRLYSSPALLRHARMCAGARAQPYSRETMTAQYLAVYERVLEAACVA